MNRELELFKLITVPDEDDNDIQYVEEFGWIKNEFVIWVSNIWWKDFIDRLVQILDYSIFDEGGFDAKIQDSCICFTLSDVTARYGVDLKSVFSKGKYKH